MSEAATETPPAKKKGPLKLVVLAVAGLLLAGGGAGGAFVLMGRGSHAAETHAEQKKPERKPLFTTLEPFTVNLQDPRGERFAQVGITLQFESASVETELKDRLPAVRNDILMLISSKHVEELLTVEGKQQLAEQIRLRTGRALGIDLPEPGAPAGKSPAPENPIRGVLFSQFIVQ